MMCAALSLALLVSSAHCPVSPAWPQVMDYGPWHVEAVPVELPVAEVARQLLDAGERFAALAVSIEGIATKPYRDAAGLNIGMGYCIRCRVASLGVERVRADFRIAGVSESDIDALLGRDRAAQDRVRLTQLQALALLGATEEGYRTRARDIVGPAHFDRLPSHRQAALTWLSYNTGDGLTRFHRLLSAVHQNRHVDALAELTPHFHHGGQRVPNARAGAWLMAAYWSEEGLTSAVANPDALEYGARLGRSPLEIVARTDARRLSREGRMPRSPYIRSAREPVSLAAVASPVENRQ